MKSIFITFYISSWLQFFFYFLSPEVSLAQKDKIVLINRNRSWDNVYFSLYNSSSNSPITSQELFIWHQLDSSKFINEIITKEPVQFNFSWNWKNQVVYAFPGDTLEFYLTNNESLPFEFTGNRHSRELMFFSLLEASKEGYLKTGNHGIEITSRLNFQYVAELTYERYLNRLQFLNEANDFYKFSTYGLRAIKQALHYKYLWELLFPYARVEQPDFDPTLIPESYKLRLRNLEPEFNRDSLLYLAEYKASLSCYAKFLMIEKGARSIDLPSILAFYKENFTGRKRDFLIFNEIKINWRQGALVNMGEWAHALESSTLQDTLILMQQRIENGFMTNLLQSILESTNGEKATLKDVLSEHRQKLIYLDFWATWCQPCLVEMPVSQVLASEFKHQDIEFIYFSIDDDRQKWLRKIPSLPSGSNAHHFLIHNGLEFIKGLDAQQSIPRYVLIGKEGRMISFNAPRPSTWAIKSLIRKNLDQ